MTLKTQRQYFGTDGIRGKANTPPMTADIVLKVAMAAASVLRARRGGNHMNRVVIGKDTRLSCYMLEQAMSAGFLSMGMEVIFLGPIPTPAVAMLTRSLRADLGVMISASHNPYQDNGIKLFGADGFKLDDQIELEIESKIDQDLSRELAGSDALGKAWRLDDALGRYAEFIKGSFARTRTLEGLKVVVDCANGAGYKIAPRVLWEMEAEVVTIGAMPNGRNINDEYGATATDNLQKAVIEHQADIGLALDGDGDRLIVVDERGNKVDGDQLMGALTLFKQQRGKLTGGGLVATVMSNLGLERLLHENGLELIRTQVGDRYVVEAMRDKGYNIGGEQSGHMVLMDYATTGDGLLAGLHILNYVKERGAPASKTLNVFEPVPQLLKNVRYSGESPMGHPDLAIAIESAHARFGDAGRVLVRASGTEPLIRVMAEGDDAAQVKKIVDELCATVEKISS
jgi:phosphoglucosamine mutase